MAREGAGTLRFQAEIKPEPDGGAFVLVPVDVASALGAAERTAVHARFDDVPCEGVVVAGERGHSLGIPHNVREVIDKAVGDMVHVVIRTPGRPEV